MKYLEKLFERIIGKEFVQARVYQTNLVFDLDMKPLKDGDRVALVGFAREQPTVRIEDEYFPTLVNQNGERVWVNIEECFRLNVYKIG